ncbi:4Fe-4S dicluster domain-containing protein [Thermoanaerobacterium thermosaccharolyticum]|uniref:4Fe-4S dicluster domain-containing protein n=1 Tax=Thermoanaerobacterium thermosaccharolyticum TaxID=1517 RepID=UPI0027AAD34B|nr:hypothetical protein [Thermoanaerobacterium sp.]WHE08433.1 4Fe-4S dicluster domain-containing protein [Thermoanaerobacterium thermosaccharolyticum]
MFKFNTDVQMLKYEVLYNVAKLTLEDRLEDEYDEIPHEIIPGTKPRFRCCVYKERAIIEQRTKVAMGKNLKRTMRHAVDGEEPIIQVLDIACEECPIKRYRVTEACRGCITHRCTEVCPKGAISIINKRANIDYDKCIECGRCKDACPYNAISDNLRPCIRSCAAKAITMDEELKAAINYEKCTSCGACTLACPFGAITDKSYIVDIIRAIKSGKKVYALVAPAIASQFKDATVGQIKSALREFGFADVIEVALGADFVAVEEAKEFEERIKDLKVMTSSCCPAFVAHIKKNYPELSHNISTTVSPMTAISKYIKKHDPMAMTVFIGPCTAKKSEVMREDIKGITDYAMTFEEMAAILDAAKIDIKEQQDAEVDDATLFGRKFARSGGVLEAVSEAIKEINADTEINPIICNGLEECNKTLKIMKAGKLPNNFVEGMACVGGCIGGAGVINNNVNQAKLAVNKFGDASLYKNIKERVNQLDTDEVDFHIGHSSDESNKTSCKEA